MRKLAFLVILGLSAFVMARAFTPAYPCTLCHAEMKGLNGNIKMSDIHKVNLTKGAHAGLYCSNCHDTNNPMILKNGAVVVPYKYATKEDLMSYNTLCAQCHPRTYDDYIHLAHGNKTWTCSGGKSILVFGYKGSPYWFHECPNYNTQFKREPARACVECHDPHDPVKLPESIMPPPSDRPKPYPQGMIEKTTIVLMALAAIVSIIAYFKP
jgi:hypothetical protein